MHVRGFLKTRGERHRVAYRRSTTTPKSLSKEEGNIITYAEISGEEEDRNAGERWERMKKGNPETKKEPVSLNYGERGKTVSQQKGEKGKENRFANL